MYKKACVSYLTTFIGFIIAFFVFAAIALWLWNIIAIPVFNAPVITYWQMYGLMWLLRLFTGASRTTPSFDKES